MASSIGVRVYQAYVTQRRSYKPLKIDDPKIANPAPTFLKGFISKNVSINQRSDIERSWYFEEKPNTNLNGSHGYVHYGTFGFESNLVDTKTKVKNYRRQSTDVEEIPLFYEIWFPKSADYGLIAFQSFQGRSCVQIVMSRMIEEFEKANPGHSLRFKKLLPTDAKSTFFAGAPVKGLRLLKRNAPSDLTDQYLGKDAYGGFDYEINIRAKRKASLGPLGDVSKSLPKNSAGVIVHEGIEFDQAIADIRVGTRIRPVHVFGASGDAGVIDLTDAIQRGADGHPTFSSIAKETSDILQSFHGALSGN